MSGVTLDAEYVIYFIGIWFCLKTTVYHQNATGGCKINVSVILKGNPLKSVQTFNLGSVGGG